MSSRERVYRTEAIVLRRSDFGEADRLLTVFTPERGKLRLIAKGARKPSSCSAMASSWWRWAASWTL
jgi:DNA repair protein RecO (recombination protein O)